MEKNASQTPSAPANPDRSDDFDLAMKILSELPTDKAMQELSKGRIGPGVTRVIETMALSKDSLVMSLRLMRMTNQVLTDVALMNKNSEDAVLAWCKANPNHKVEIVACEPNDPDRIIHD